MKHAKYISVFIYIQFILFMAGCKIIDWGKENFKQTDRYNNDLIKYIQPFIASTIVYDQFETIAQFDAIFLTDKARMYYVDYFAQRHILSEEKESVMRQRLLNENKYYISFYIVGSQLEYIYPNNRSFFTGRHYKQKTLLGERDAEWQVKLKVADQEYAPDSIRVVELPIEWQYFLGAKYSQFKSVYLIKFDAIDQFDKEILPAGKHKVSLLFTSACYKTMLEWKDVIYTQKID